MSEATILDLFRRDVDHPRSDAYTHATLAGPRTLSTTEFFAGVAALSAALEALGVSRGDRVLLLSDNRPEWHQVDLAVLDLGAVDVPIYPTLTADQIAYQVADSGAGVAVADSPEQMGKLIQVRARCPELKHLVQMDGPCADGVEPLAQLVDRHRGTEAEQAFWHRAAEVKADDLASIVYTSGTTGPPKGVMLSHRNFVSNVEAVLPRVPLDSDDLGLEFLPLCHVFERTVGYAYMGVACRKAYCTPSLVAEVLPELAPTAFASVPRLYEKIHAKILVQVEGASPTKRRLFQWAVDTGSKTAVHRREGQRPPMGLRMRHAVADRLVLRKIRAGLGGRTRCVISGGAPLLPSLNEFFHAVGIPIQEGYGLTETSPAIGICGYQPGENRVGSIGRPLENLQVKLADDGELLVKGPSVFRGYWNKPEATEEVFDDEGFFHTGDIARIEDGFIYITDRKKDIIIPAGGKNVAPQEIENRLKKSPYIENAVLVGDQRPYIIALLSPAEEELGAWAEEQGLGGTELDELIREPRLKQLFQSLVDELNQDLGRFEQIKDFRILARPLTIEEGHLTPTMKVKRRVVERELADLIEDMYR